MPIRRLEVILFWLRMWDSNSPSQWLTVTPMHLARVFRNVILVLVVGLELTTYCLQNSCSTGWAKPAFVYLTEVYHNKTLHMLVCNYLKHVFKIFSQNNYDYHIPKCQPVFFILFCFSLQYFCHPSKALFSHI